MDIIQTITGRRSIRKFKNEEVPRKLIDQVISAGASAPSAYNHQPWEFVLITDRNVLNKIAEFSHYYAVASSAGAILVCGNTKKEEDDGLLIQSCSAAIENILIATHGLGLGAVWTSIYPFPENMAYFQEVLNLPEYVIPITIVPFGYPEIDSARSGKRLDIKVHENRW